MDNVTDLLRRLSYEQDNEPRLAEKPLRVLTPEGEPLILLSLNWDRDNDCYWLTTDRDPDE